jgi:hypothetical protein
MRGVTRRRCGGAMAGGVLLAIFAQMGARAGAQACTTQAKLAPAVRSALADVSVTLATAVKAGDAARVQSMTIAEFAGNQESFAPTAALVHSTAQKIAPETLQVTQVYQLDARGRAKDAEAPAEFTCALTDSASETDFSIPGLPPGLYGFSMVEATGSQPWLLAFLLRQDAGVWKLAGFYPRARTAGGHDGGWFWAQGYEAGKSKQLWLAWLYFSEADQLLRPANFVTSTKLDNLRAEQHTAAPPELANGVSPESPLVLKVGGVQYPVTDLEVASSADGQHLNLMLHVSVAAGDGSSTDTMAQARAVSVAQALIDAHVELRPAFQDVWVFAEATQQNPAVTVLKMAEIP